jgi:hypothetical protein
VVTVDAVAPAGWEGAAAPVPGGWEGAAPGWEGAVPGNWDPAPQ